MRTDRHLLAIYESLSLPEIGSAADNLTEDDKVAEKMPDYLIRAQSDRFKIIANRGLHFPKFFVRENGEKITFEDVKRERKIIGAEGTIEYDEGALIISSFDHSVIYMYDHPRRDGGYEAIYTFITDPGTNLQYKYEGDKLSVDQTLTDVFDRTNNIRSKVLYSEWEDQYFITTSKIGADMPLYKKYYDRTTRLLSKKTIYNKDGQVVYSYIDGELVSVWEEIDRLDKVIETDFYPNSNFQKYKVTVSISFNDQMLSQQIYSKNGHLQYFWDREKDIEQFYNEKGEPIENPAVAKANTYNRQYGGVFLHALTSHDLDQLLDLNKEEVCVSTVRANTYFGGEGSQHRNIVLFGFGKIRELYDFDAYTHRTDSGKRVATVGKFDQSPHLHNIDRSKISKFIDSKYYDEGIMPWGSADVLMASIPRLRYGEDQDLKRILKRRYPYIQFIKPDAIKNLINSEDLLRRMYMLRDRRDAKKLMQSPFYKYEEKVNLTFKDFFLLENNINIPIERAYEIFKAEYEKSTGTSWTYDKFISRAGNWEFYGDMNGFVAVRKQRSGFVKLVGMAGSNKSKLKGIQDLISMNLPLWGMVSKDIRDIAIKKGMREPNFIEKQFLKKNISPEVLGGAQILEYQNDGGIKIKYPDVGIVVKYLVGSPQYYNQLKSKFIKNIM